ncbi:isoprenoid synthase domain-containing protein [Podospora australis]|uniref:Terpene synthase n=1 Tax=Podospora australis TaxID=1536484 RepID=A0AAN7AIY3_9PEZI|nr:isoprenoid synthase domain-containing protein [Podospora australis]
MSTSTETLTWFKELDSITPTIARERSAGDIAKRLKGQTLRIPDLQHTFSHFPNEISPFYNRLKVVVDAKIDEWIDEKDVRMRKKAKKCNIPLFSATWYPRATFDRLTTISWYTLFLFLWDDIIESYYHPEDEAKVDVMQKQALQYMHHELGLSRPGTDVPLAPTKYCTLFQHCAVELLHNARLDVRKRFFCELQAYMEGCGIEKAYVSSGTLPTFKQYWEHRLGTSSLHTYAALNEYMSGGNIPDCIFGTKQLETVWLELNRHVVILNDLVSFRKEVAEDSYHSLIPVIMAENSCDLDTAVNIQLVHLQTVGNNLDNAANALANMVKNENAPTRVAVENYVNCFRTNITGNYWWSLMCDRYGITKYLQEDGTLIIPL